MSAKGKSANHPPQQAAFDYIKSNFFRVIRVDGAFGGLVPSGVIHMDLYSERPPIPKKIVYDLSETGEPGQELSRESRSAWIREVEVGVTMDLNTAMILHTWLGEKINTLQAAFAEANARSDASQTTPKKGNGDAV